jgi:elongation factor P hydroxylase
VWGKFLNAVSADDRATMRDVGWRYAHAAAMRIALLEQVPYESGRTLWADAVSRGYHMGALVANLTAGPTTDQQNAMRAVWGAVLDGSDPPA